MSLITKLMSKFGVRADDGREPSHSLLERSEEGLDLAAAKEQLTEAVQRNVAASVGLVRATKRNIRDAEFVKITVDSVLARAEQAARDRNDA
jgi:hypothetical protein